MTGACSEVTDKDGIWLVLTWKACSVYRTQAVITKGGQGRDSNHLPLVWTARICTPRNGTHRLQIECTGCGL